jgi:hypothetical protein
LAAHAFHYLVIFDEMGRVLDLVRTKRIASPDQRIVLLNKIVAARSPVAPFRGFSPKCTMPNVTGPRTVSPTSTT